MVAIDPDASLDWQTSPSTIEDPFPFCTTDELVQSMEDYKQQFVAEMIGALFAKELDLKVCDFPAATCERLVSDMRDEFGAIESGQAGNLVDADSLQRQLFLALERRQKQLGEPEANLGADFYEEQGALRAEIDKIVRQVEEDLRRIVEKWGAQEMQLKALRVVLDQWHHGRLPIQYAELIAEDLSRMHEKAPQDKKSKYTSMREPFFPLGIAMQARIDQEREHDDEKNRKTLADKIAEKTAFIELRRNPFSGVIKIDLTNVDF